MDDRLLEPLKAYQDFYAHEFAVNTKDAFDDLVRRSGVNVDENRATVKSYHEEQAKIAEMDKKLSSHRTQKVLLIILAVIGVFLLIFGIVNLVNQNLVAGIVMLLLGIILPAVAIAVIVCVIQPKLKNAEAEKQKYMAKAKELLDRAWQQTAPLNALFDSRVTKELIEKTVPLLQIDDNFNMRRYDYLRGKYGFGENGNPERSTIGILTGEILGNPFVVDRELVHNLGSEDYTGYLQIHWTTSYTDSKGHRVTQHHSQTLSATVTKPKPFYHQETRLIYGNEAVPDLHFTHKPSHAEAMSEKELERKVKSGSKEIQKMQQKAVKKGGSNFTEMGNAEFDVLFGALDRDNEVQFRLLFTPLAQKNMLALMKDNTCGWGDDFYFTKSRCLNFISSQHSASWDMNTDYTRYYSYNIDESREKFTSFNCNYFKSLYFDFAPLLSLPLYQQHKPAEYIYQHEYERQYTDYEAEYAVNAMGQKSFAPADAGTDSILKTRFLSRDGASDRVEVSAYSYRTVDRTDYVSVFGGDGRWHNVPVHWVEYIPVQRRSCVMLKELGISEREFANKAYGGSPLQQTLEKYIKNGYRHGILCSIVGAEDEAFDKAIADAIK